MSAPTLHQRLVGGLIGSVVGDALGVPVEFTGRSVRDRDPVTGMRGFGTWNQEPGTWSDDSSMTLTTAECLLSGWDPAAMIEGFRRWLDDNRWTARGSVFDVGNTTRNAISLYRISGSWRECGRCEETDNGNGSLMRALPISAWLFGRPVDEVIRLAGEASALTHGHPRSRLCCALHAVIAEGLLSGQEARAAIDSAVRRLRPHIPADERAPLQAVLDGTALDQHREHVRSDGYVVSTLEAALWCLAQHDDFAGAVLAAVNLGGDTDTTAAVAGGLAGLRGGIEAIPAQWIDILARRDEVLDLANRFADACLAHWEGAGPP